MLALLLIMIIAILLIIYIKILMVLFSYYSCLMPKYDTIFRASTCPAAQNVYDSLYRRLGS